MAEIQTAFDGMSTDYDKSFSNTYLGEYYRDRTHDVMERYWSTPSNLLEINAGTGEDAIFLAQRGHHVHATDISSKMLEQLSRKAVELKLEAHVSFQTLPIEAIDSLPEAHYDGLLSNFGGLNCVHDLSTFAKNAHYLVKPGAVVILCVMGPWVPWEWSWYSMHGDMKSAFRRVSGKTQWRDSHIYYPSLRTLKKTMAQASFRCLHTEALGVLMPPSYVNSVAESYRGIFDYAAQIENRIARLPGMANLSDHYLLAFEKFET
ncbi:Ubiquinone/menaquinone biosynthesis C-methyltransferase UbiE [BD1-7 clade bacterium]|uniref:Ubiquinone/menaquinone biosynthesis C-methyltransferase UbiE n=1 Tax=BD1-7 clade bacterium TaxID=2029982 RepID=A0A5S9PBX0_9GAMM|nr:Ubiquinone/menaquinone biosynthesis C-methyltransferase UbiE [BD1-7 clade bacterium]CAA0101278.1 Ubiquinone/menaquinone biosynthesis C-methyltransferase UbiE [BD1-7 clade bacterium]